MSTFTHNIRDYKTIVFDCDGVILNSNIVKTDAYFRTAIALGGTKKQAQALVDYHVKLGGISRYHKFDYYLRDIIKTEATSDAIQTLLDRFSEELQVGLMQCEIAEGLQALRALTANANWLVLSGGDQAEIRTLFAKRDLEKYFDAGLFGSPDNKDEVLAREQSNGNIKHPALFIGDSKYDYEAANRAGLDVVFLSGWTEVPDWREYCEKHAVTVKPDVAALLT